VSDLAAEAASVQEEEPNFLSMSDEDIMSMSSPTAEVPVAEEPAAVVEPAVVEPVAAAPVEANPLVDPVAALPGSGEAVAAPAVVEGEVAPVEAKAGPADYEGFYNQIMTPFKANGKTIELKSPDEAVQLMQMGANYTRKMQELVPHRKTITMLQNNNIDEGKLSFLIDLDKKNPEAIKKLLKESGIDPLDIDTSSEPAYLEGNHQVTDEEVNFRTALEEVSSTPDGKATLQVINSDWDQASKDVLWKNPETMALIHGQREFGIYDRITEEMARQKTLGTIPAGKPFLEAYKIVGDQLTAAGAFADLVEKHQGNAPSEAPASPGPATSKVAPEPVVTRAATPKPAVSNGAAAGAASPTRAAPTTAQVFVNPLSMSDDDFLKTFNGRL